jgi:probable rRNA maturation factor
MEPPSRSSGISFSNQTSRRIPVTAIRAAVRACLTRHDRSGDVSFSFIGAEEMARLNVSFRHVEGATDVLTFPAPKFPGAPLGDIAICVPFAQSQAVMRRVALRTELVYLAIHGVLHLCGFDDETPEEREDMMAEMGVIGGMVGLPVEDEWTSIAKGCAA